MAHKNPCVCADQNPSHWVHSGHTVNSQDTEEWMKEKQTEGKIHGYIIYPHKTNQPTNKNQKVKSSAQAIEPYFRCHQLLS